MSCHANQLFNWTKQVYFQDFYLRTEIEGESHIMVNVGYWLELAWHTREATYHKANSQTVCQHSNKPFLLQILHWVRKNFNLVEMPSSLKVKNCNQKPWDHAEKAVAVMCIGQRVLILPSLCLSEHKNSCVPVFLRLHLVFMQGGN